MSRYACDKCDYITINKQRLDSHSNVHITTKNFKCNECPSKFKTVDTLKRHIKRKNHKKKLECKECVFTAFYYPIMKEHEREHYPFRCDKCPFTTRSENHYKSHMDKHETVFKCNICEKSHFKNSNSLRVHLRYHKMKDIQFQDCIDLMGKNFSSRQFDLAKEK